ncbi:MAG: hypothetical protein ACRDY1_11925 [Acidimicrobiales bacterium]
MSRGTTARTLARSLTQTGAVDRPGRADSLARADEVATVTAVVRRTPVTVLEAHLTWLVDGVRGTDHRAPRRVTAEDQARILLHVLEERGEDEAVARGLEQRWQPSMLDDDHPTVRAYAAALDRAAGGRRRCSPFVDLARSAAALSAGVVGTPVTTARPASP